MGVEADGSVNLGLLVLHESHLLGVAEEGGLSGARDRERLAELLIAVLLQNMGIEVKHGERVGLHGCRVLWRASAPQPDVLQHYVGVTVVVAPHHSPVVVHDVEHGILAPIRSTNRRGVVGAAEEPPFPPRSGLDVKGSTRRFGLELVAVVRVLFQEAQHPVQVYVDDHRRELPDPGQGHPQRVVGEPEPLGPALDLRQRALVVHAGEAADVCEGRLLALQQLGGLLELRGCHYKPPRRLRLLVDPCLQQRQLQVLRIAVVCGPADPLAPLLEELHAPAHAAHVGLELGKVHSARPVPVELGNELLHVVVRGGKTQVVVHALQLLPAKRLLAGAAEALEGGAQHHTLRLQLALHKVQRVARVAAATLDGLPRPFKERVQHVLLIVKEGVAAQDV
mmetsp:Transcript_132491/g.411911  ORF Transcript_132491/g.411911 Transcript_132491/m.411911 type:complete len:394 (-) Transcript_132491:67-1248(-)